MATVKMLWGPASIGSVTAASAALGAAALNDADNAAAWCFCVPKDGSITDVGVYLTAENGTSPQYNVKLVTQDSSGRPTTTDYGSSTGTPTTWTSTGWKWVTLTGAATAAAGDFAAVHVYPTGTAPDGSNNISVQGSSGIIAVGEGASLYYTTAWTANAGQPAMAVKYSDGSIHGFALSSNTTYVQIRSNTTPDEVGSLFQVPASMTVYGARVYAAAAGWGSAATADVLLYNAAGTALATGAIGDKDYVDDSGTINVFFDAVTLSADTDYRLVIRPNVSTNGDIYVTKWSFESTAARSYPPEGARWQYTSRTDAGAWTDDNTAVCPFGLWVSDIDFSGGTVTTIFEGGPLSAEFPSSNFPALTPVNGRVALAFDASTDEAAYWCFVCPQGGIGTTLSCVVYYAMASATSGAVYWQAALEAVTPGDSLDLDATTSFDTANSGNGTVPGTAGYMQAITITMTNKDSIAAGDLVWLKLNRDADNASDTATGDALLYRVELRSA